MRPASLWAREHPRLTGVILLSLGLFLAHWFIWAPLKAAVGHSPHVGLHLEGVTAAEFFTLAGLLLMIRGTQGRRFLRLGKIDWKHLKPRQFAIAFGFILPGFLIFYWMQWKLETMGYVF